MKFKRHLINCHKEYLKDPMLESAKCIVKEFNMSLRRGQKYISLLKVKAMVGSNKWKDENTRKMIYE